MEQQSVARLPAVLLVLLLFWHTLYTLVLLLVSYNLKLKCIFILSFCYKKSYHLVFIFINGFFSDFDIKYFWDWSDFQSYMDCMLVFTILSSIVMYLFIDRVIFVEIMGFLAVFTEASLGVPQLLKNFRSKSTEGMR